MTKKRLAVLLSVALSLGIVLSITIVRFMPAPPPRPTNELEAKYGKKLYSEYDEELIIRDFFDDRRDGFFLDVGCSHYKTNSTTYFLEKHLNWSGIAIDALPQYAADYKRFRPNTRFYSFFISDRSDQRKDFHIVPRNPVLSTGDKGQADRWGGYEDDSVQTITLNDLLNQAGVSKINLLSMDIELFEPKALAGFDIERFRPELVCIEAHPQVRDQLMDYFTHHGYKEISRYSKYDWQNKYFMPAK